MTDTLYATTLHRLHQQHGARLVGFAGYTMPLCYRPGIKQEHLHTRARASLFDVSHMGQIDIRGAAVPAGLARLVPSDVEALPPYHSRYSVLTNVQGGVRDDVIITPYADGPDNGVINGARLVVNAACRQQDLDYLKQHLQADALVTMLDDHALLALQGPAAVTALQRIIPAVAGLRFMQAGRYRYDGAPVFISRSGYTGEDGFEISLPDSHTQRLAEQLLDDEAVQLAGLGARDSLRLEAGLCLYGNELKPDISVIEADLGWLIARKYRTADAADNSRRASFPGAALLLRQLEEGTEKVRCGLAVSGRIPVRSGAVLTAADGAAAGVVSSGGYAPTLAAPIAMAYVQRAYLEPGATLYAAVRGRRLALTVTALPFVPHRYSRRDVMSV